MLCLCSQLVFRSRVLLWTQTKARKVKKSRRGLGTRLQNFCRTQNLGLTCTYPGQVYRRDMTCSSVFLSAVCHQSGDGDCVPVPWCVWVGPRSAWNDPEPMHFSIATLPYQRKGEYCTSHSMQWDPGTLLNRHPSVVNVYYTMDNHESPIWVLICILETSESWTPLSFL